jgi:hypothetical protein
MPPRGVEPVPMISIDSAISAQIASYDICAPVFQFVALITYRALSAEKVFSIL